MDKTQDREAGKLTPAELRTLRDFDNLPDSADVRVRVVSAWRGISVPTVWRHSKLGLLPEPEKRGGVTTWNVGKLRAAFK